MAEESGAHPAWHAAFLAWRELVPDSPDATRVDPVSLSCKSEVYRIEFDTPDHGTVVAKCCNSQSARLELAIHNQILAALPVRTLKLHGIVPHRKPELSWLLLEDAGELAYDGEQEGHQKLAIDWLAGLHAGASSFRNSVELPHRGPAHYRTCLERVRESLKRTLELPGLTGDRAELLFTVVRQCDVVEGLWDDIEAECEEVPRTLVHGDFVPKNLRIDVSSAAPSLLVMDWEMAGWGVPAADLESWGEKALERYHATVHGHSSSITSQCIGRLASVGKLFRCLTAMHWCSLEFNGTEHWHWDGAFTDMQVYQEHLAQWLSCEHPSDAGR